MVFSSAYVADCDQVKMALSLAGIESMMKNEFGNPIGFVLVGGVASFTWPALWVDDADYDKAMQIAGDYISAAKGSDASGSAPAANVGVEWQCPKCGEVIEGTMQSCWKCDTTRPAEGNAHERGDERYD